MAQHVGRDPWSHERRARRAGRCRRVFVGDTQSRLASSPGLGPSKELGDSRFATNGQPGTNRCRDGLPEGEDPVFPALPTDLEIHVARLERHVARRRPTNSDTRRPAAMPRSEHGAITDAGPGRRNRCLEKARALHGSQVGDQLAVNLLSGHREDSV